MYIYIYIYTYYIYVYVSLSLSFPLNLHIYMPTYINIFVHLHNPCVDISKHTPKKCVYCLYTREYTIILTRYPLTQGVKTDILGKPHKPELVLPCILATA